MSGNKNYPDWGTFGEADAPLTTASKPSESTGDTQLFDIKMRIGLIEIETTPTDTPEQIETAMQKAYDLNTLSSSSPSGVTVKRSNASAIDVVIDKALRDVGEDARLGVVYAELVRLASTADRKPFTGPATISGIPYLHNNGRVEHFTRRALMGRLKTLRRPKP